jgi:MFS family permease
MHQHHRGLGSVGLALAAHTLGMFALSPVTGWLADRRGSVPVMAAGLATLAASAVLVAATPQDRTLVWVSALFLLGYGWNLAFVGGSGHLAGDLPADERARVEGAVDAAVWGFAAVASLGSVAMLSVGGYVLIAAASLALLAPAAIVLARRSTPEQAVI